MDFASEYRAAIEKFEVIEPTAEVYLPVPGLGPDFRFHFIARRIDLAQMLYSGALPERLALIFLSSDKKNVEKVFAGLSPQEQMTMMGLQRKMAVAVCKEPRLVYSETPAPGELSMYTLRQEVITALFLYAMQMSPDVPVAIDGANGESESVTVGAVETFRPQPELLPVLPDGEGHSEGIAVADVAAAR